jgi:hypothetical protein
LILIKLDSRGPILFTHERVGKDGRVFRLHKFRTMQSDTNPYAVAPGDQTRRSFLDGKSLPETDDVRMPRPAADQPPHTAFVFDLGEVGLQPVSRCLMLEERKNGMRVLAICPGSVNTPFFDDHHDADDPKRRRILKPEDVADSILHMIQLPQRAMVSEIDIRPSNP